MAAGAIRRAVYTAAPKWSDDPLYRRILATPITDGDFVAKTIDRYISSGGKVDEANLLYCALRLRSKPNHAIQMINWMEARNIKIGYKGHALRISVITELKGIDAAERYFKSLPRAVKYNAIALRELLYCYCKAAKVDKALRVFYMIDRRGMMNGTTPITNLMWMYTKIRQWEKVPHLMEEMKKRNIQPDTPTYKLVMHSYMCLDDVEGVGRVFEEMERNNKVYGWLIYSRFANFFIRVGLRGKAEVALKKMEEEMGSSNRRSFHSLISLYAEISDYENVHRIWESLKSNFKEVTSMSYFTMHHAVCKLIDINGVKKCYDEWESTCSLIDNRLANRLIATYLSHDKPDEAALIFRAALDRSQGPITEACEYFITYHLKKRQIMQALQYLEIATSKNKDQKWRPNMDNINGFLRYFREGNDVGGARQFCELTKMVNSVHTKAYVQLLNKVSITLAKGDSGTTNQNLGGVSEVITHLPSTDSGTTDRNLGGLSEVIMHPPSTDSGTMNRNFGGLSEVITHLPSTDSGTTNRNIGGVSEVLTDSGTTNQNLGGVSEIIMHLPSTEVKAEAQSTPRLSENPLHQRLLALGINKGELVSETIDAYKSEGRSIDKFLLFVCARDLCKYNRSNHALQIINWMEAQGFDIGFKEHVLRMKLINRVKGIDATESYFNSLPASVKNTSTALRTLLFCYCEFNKVDKALDVFSRMDCMNLIDVALSITDLMMLYVKLGQPEKVPPLMEEMKKRNIQPSAYAYNLLIHSYSCLNDAEGVERTFEEMKRNNEVQCGWTTYSNLSIFYTRSGLRAKAKATLKKMEELMDSNNSECFHFLISLYAKIHDIHSVHRIWKSLRCKFKQVTGKSYLIMLEALSKQNNINGMKMWYEEWESTCSLFDIRLPNLLIGTYLTHGKPDEAQLIFCGVLDRSQGPIFEACEHFMNYYLKKEQIKQALLYLRVATSKNGDKEWQPKEDIVSGFLNYFKNNDDFGSTKQFCELVNEMNCIDRELHHSLLTQALEKEQKMYDLLLMDILKDCE